MLIQCDMKMAGVNIRDFDDREQWKCTIIIQKVANIPCSWVMRR